MLKVLIVDDEAVILQGMQVLIDWQAEGYEIAALCKDGREALEYLRSHPVDLVIADVMMPVMSGLELLETVKREHISEASFVILSGYGEFAFAQQALRLGCMDYLLKPIEKEQLLAILRRSSNVTENARMEHKYEQAYLTRNLIALLYGKEPGPDMAYLRNHLRLSPGLRYIEIEAVIETEADAEGDTVEPGEIREQLYQCCHKILEADAGHCVMEISATQASTAVGFLYCDYMAADRGLTEAQYIRQLHRQLPAPSGIWWPSGPASPSTGMSRNCRSRPADLCCCGRSWMPWWRRWSGENTPSSCRRWTPSSTVCSPGA